MFKKFNEFINEGKKEEWFFYLNNGTTSVKSVMASSEKEVRELAFDKYNPEESNFIELHNFTTDLSKIDKAKY